MAPTRLGEVEIDLLATHAGASIPYPLRIPSFGHIQAARDELFAIAGETLQLRGLATDHGPTGIAADLVTALTHRHATIDLVIHDPHATRRAVAILYDHHALLCHHGFTDPHTTAIDIDKINPHRVAAALTDLVPDQPAATTMPIRVPSDIAHAVHDTITNNDPNSADLVHRTRRIITEQGGNPNDFDTLDALLAAPTSSGQIGATTASGNGTDTRTGTELSWIDTPTGRVRITGPPPDTTGWLSINPLHTTELHTAVRDLISLIDTTRRPAHANGG